MLTLDEVAAVFGVGYSTARRWHQEGRLQSAQLPLDTVLRYRKADILQLKDERARWAGTGTTEVRLMPFNRRERQHDAW